MLFPKQYTILDKVFKKLVNDDSFSKVSRKSNAIISFVLFFVALISFFSLMIETSISLQKYFHFIGTQEEWKFIVALIGFFFVLIIAFIITIGIFCIAVYHLSRHTLEESKKIRKEFRVEI